MNRSNNRSLNRYHHDEIVYENYEDDYDLPLRMQIQHQGELKEKESGKFRRSRKIIPSALPMKKPVLSHFKNESADGIIVDEDGEEEEVYEEISDVEDTEYETGVVEDPSRNPYRHSNNTHKSPTRLAAARCIACNQCYTEKYRLFRWPRNEGIRKIWCDLLHIDFDNIRSSLDSAFLCASHFSSTDFICSSDFTQIHWSSQAKPRPPSECLDPYQWEKLHSRISNGRSRQNYIIKFRPSKYKVQNTSKIRHPVAIVSSLSRPNIQYEFSWNRTSPIDGTKFYSCLHCRKANKDSGGKDNVRTIHLNGNKLLSGQDPLSGHHHACNPLRIHSRMEEMDEGERYDRDDDVEMYKKHDGFQSGEMNGSDKNGLNPGERIVYVDDSHAFSSTAVVEVEASEGLWTTTEEDGTTVTMHTVDGHHSNMDEILMDGPSTSHGWVDYSKMDEIRVWKEEEAVGRRDMIVATNKIIKKYRNRGRPYSVPSLSCPICTHRLPSTTRLIQHLEEHERNGRECAVCRGK
ncbi:hypothetical protein PRIPAC_93140 [Pristionchus pacificus]|nr:hypothetical protein PRIPAC_93140 [Pristionchus pacificus]